MEQIQCVPDMPLYGMCAVVLAVIPCVRVWLLLTVRMLGMPPLLVEAAAACAPAAWLLVLCIRGIVSQSAAFVVVHRKRLFGEPACVPCSMSTPVSTPSFLTFSLPHRTHMCPSWPGFGPAAAHRHCQCFGVEVFCIMSPICISHLSFKCCHPITTRRLSTAATTNHCRTEPAPHTRHVCPCWPLRLCTPSTRPYYSVGRAVLV